MILPDGAGLVRSIGRWSLAALVLNAIIGSGIFALPGTVAARLGTQSLMAWLVAALVIGVIMACFAEVASRFPGASRELLTWSIDTWESFRHQARRKDSSDPSPQLGLRNLIVLLERIQDGEDRWEAAEVAFVNAHLLDSEGHAAAKLQLQMMLPGQDR
jgi:hypothetical protein